MRSRSNICIIGGKVRVRSLDDSLFTFFQIPVEEYVCAKDGEEDALGLLRTSPCRCL